MPDEPLPEEPRFNEPHLEEPRFHESHINGVITDEQDSDGSSYDQVQKDRVIYMPGQDEEEDYSSDILYEPTIVAPGGSSSGPPQTAGSSPGEPAREVLQEQNRSVSREADAGWSAQDSGRRFQEGPARQVPRAREESGPVPAGEHDDVYTDPGYPGRQMGGTGYDDEPGKGSAIASLVLGILSILFWFSFSFLSVGGPLLGLISGIAGIICASLSSKQGNRSGLRTAGFVCSLIGSIGNLLGFITCVACVGMFASVYGDLFNNMAGGSL